MGGDPRADKVEVVDNSLIHTGLSSDQDIPPANYAVRSQKLSLCLHVLQNRLQQRMREFELQLQQSKSKIHLKEEEGKILGVTSPLVRTNLLQLHKAPF